MRIIFVSKRICSDLKLSNHAIGAYIALRSVYRPDKSELYVNVNMLCRELTGSMCFTRNLKEKIGSGLDELIENEIVSVAEGAGKNEWVLNCSKLFIDVTAAAGSREYYIKVYREEIQRIFAIEGRHDKFGVLRFFVMMMGTLDYNIEAIRDERGDMLGTPVKNFFGHMGTEHLAVIAGTSKDVGIDYTQLLEEAKLIYVYRHKYLVWDECGNIKSFNNNYGRYRDAALIKTYAMAYEEMNGSDIVRVSKAEVSRRNRSMAQKYSHFANGKQYDIETVKEIYEFVHEKNVEIQTICSKERNQGVINDYLAQLRDEACFNAYLDKNGMFITEKEIIDEETSRL